MAPHERRIPADNEAITDFNLGMRPFETARLVGVFAAQTAYNLATGLASSAKAVIVERFGDRSE